MAQLRREAQERDTELAKLRQQGMTDADKAIAKAREEGKAEAAAEHARQLAAAEFRAQAAGKLANPEAALAALNLDALVKDGAPDSKAIGKLVEQLAVVPPPPGRIPPGPMPGPGDANHDWLRDIQRSR